MHQTSLRMMSRCCGKLHVPVEKSTKCKGVPTYIVNNINSTGQQNNFHIIPVVN